jgi:hypothetical protein
VRSSGWSVSSPRFPRSGKSAQFRLVRFPPVIFADGSKLFPQMDVWPR